MTIAELVLAQLKTKFDGVDEPILKRIADKKAQGVTDEGKVTEIANGVSLQDVVQSYGDYRADQAQKSAVSNYEKKFKLKNGKPLEEADDESDEKDDKKTDKKKNDEKPDDEQDKKTEEDKVDTYTKDEIAKMISDLKNALTEANKPLSEKIATLEKANAEMQEEKSAKEFNAKLLEKAKANKISEEYLKFLTPKRDSTDEELDAYMKGFAQLQANNKFGGGKPEDGEPDEQDETKNIADAINKRTEEMVKATT